MRDRNSLRANRVVPASFGSGPGNENAIVPFRREPLRLRTWASKIIAGMADATTLPGRKGAPCAEADFERGVGVELQIGNRIMAPVMDFLGRLDPFQLQFRADRQDHGQIGARRIVLPQAGSGRLAQRTQVRPPVLKPRTGRFSGPPRGTWVLKIVL